MTKRGDLKEVMVEDNTKLFATALSYLGGELLGAEFVKFHAQYQVRDLGPVEAGEKVIPEQLSEKEKMFWHLVDAAFEFTQRRKMELPGPVHEVLKEMTTALKDVFWAMIKLNHHAFISQETGIGIRGDYVIVGLPTEDRLKGLMRALFEGQIKAE